MDKKKMLIMAVVLIVILIALIAGTESFRSGTSTETTPNNTGTTSKNENTRITYKECEGILSKANEKMLENIKNKETAGGFND